MKHIKNYLFKVQEEFKGVSKGALATVMILETIVCVILITFSLVINMQAGYASQVTESAMQVNTELNKQVYDLQIELKSYKQMYDDVRQELTELSKSDKN